MSGDILEASDVTLRRGRKTILDDLSFSVARNERILIRGKSGAGKTSLFRILGLLEPPTGGAVVVDGTDATAADESVRARLRREKLGFVFQDFQLIPDLTAWENARLPQEHGSGGESSDWMEAVFEQLDIADLAERYPSSLSGGERQRVAITRAVANKPGIILADEPTGQLDPETTDRVLDLLFEVRETADAALVVISHDDRLTDAFPAGYELLDGGLERKYANNGRVSVRSAAADE
jgi:putative ABC transport system ATP-binding protein